jgi:hypothetical protein
MFFSIGQSVSVLSYLSCVCLSPHLFLNYSFSVCPSSSVILLCFSSISIYLSAFIIFNCLSLLVFLPSSFYIIFVPPSFRNSLSPSGFNLLSFSFVFLDPSVSSALFPLLFLSVVSFHISLSRFLKSFLSCFICPALCVFFIYFPPSLCLHLSFFIRLCSFVLLYLLSTSIFLQQSS